MLEKWISLLEESGVPWGIFTAEPEDPFDSREIVLFLDGSNVIRFKYDSAEEKVVVIGSPNG